MSRKTLVIAAIAAAVLTVTVGSVTVNAGLLDDVTNNLPDLDGDGIDLPGGGNVNLPGGGSGGGVTLPGGQDLDDVTDPIIGGSDSDPAPAPVPGTPTVPPSDGSDGGTDTGGYSPDSDGAARGPQGGRGKGQAADDEAETKRERNKVEEPPVRRPDGTPTAANPTVSIVDFGPAPLGVPNFIIDRFTIPPFLLPIYQACGTEYGIPWNVLASINRIETAFGTNLNVSSAGALGWMQFIPSTWQAYGVDGNNDGRKDPYNPVDAICAAARYLKAAGGQEDLARAIFAYNHADWYVDEVLFYAKQYGEIPADLVSSITGLTEGARFPVAENARYADDIADRRAEELDSEAAAEPAEEPTPRGINIYTKEGAPAVAVNDGTIRNIGHSKQLGDFVVLEDNYGNRFTYAELGDVAKAYPVPRRGEDGSTTHSEGEGSAEEPASSEPANTEDTRERMFALPYRQIGMGAVGEDSSDEPAPAPDVESFESQFGPLRFDPEKMELRPLEKGSKVVAGTILGEVGSRGQLAPHLHFAIRPAGRGAPQINPKPILDGWKLLEATHLYRAAGRDPFADSIANASQVLLFSKEQATKALLDEPRVLIYECGIQDVRTGQIDVRVMRMLLYLARTGFRLTVTSLKCGHSVYTTSGNVSAHSVGSAADIAQINGLPVLGNQGGGSVTEALIRQLLELQGAMTPDQIISLMEMGGPTFAMGDHDDHVHVGYSLSGASSSSGGFEPQQFLGADQWRRLIRRLGEIENPEVLPTPGAAKRRASVAHDGE